MFCQRNRKLGGIYPVSQDFLAVSQQSTFVDRIQNAPPFSAGS